MKQEPSCGSPWSQQKGRAFVQVPVAPMSMLSTGGRLGFQGLALLIIPVPGGQGKGPRSWAATNQHGRVVSCPLAPHVAMPSSVPVYRGCAWFAGSEVSLFRRFIREAVISEHFLSPCCGIGHT